jgi:hypothetical protein
MWNLFSNPAFLFVIVSLIGLFFTYIGGKIHGLLSKKEYQEAVKYCVDELVLDDDFIKDAGQIVAKSYKMNNKTALKIIDLPVVKMLTREYIKKFSTTPAGGELLSQDWLQMELRDLIVKEWNVHDTEIMLIKKLKFFKTGFQAE